MKVDLIETFQTDAVMELTRFAHEASDTYIRLTTSRADYPQVISFTAPTGAGKTIIMTAVIENILFGDDFFPEQPDAVFVWLSDSPQLNEQSRDKIDSKSDRIRLDQCVMIREDSFDQEVLDGGRIYFLNTQKLSTSSKLVKKGDFREYSIWETIANTAREKADRFYFIIDEAHRGAKIEDFGKTTTIMQKFMKGSPKDGLPAMPVVIGMSATIERFEALAKGLHSTTYHCKVEPEDVRGSGLLKDRIVIDYPENGGENEMAVLQAAADDWKQKWNHWDLYCKEQHETNVNPVFVIQVAEGKGDHLSETDLDDCLKKIEERTGFRFTQGEVVHTFGDTDASITVNGLEVRYVEPSRIADDRKIKVVFFKENLSTGWDCPRAETMMSFCRRQDATYIAQLLGRMVRTPLQRHIIVDDVLNDVHLYLPYFDKDAVGKVITELQGSEGGTLPADVYGESMERKDYDFLTSRPSNTGYAPSRTVRNQEDGAETADIPKEEDGAGEDSHSRVSEGYAYGGKDGVSESSDTAEPKESESSEGSGDSDFMKPEEYDSWEADRDSQTTDAEIPETKSADLFDRSEIIDFINDACIPTYHVRPIRRSSSYFKSLCSLAHLLSQSGLYAAAVNDINRDVVEQIHNYIEKLKADGLYDGKVEEAMRFQLQEQVFDAFGESVDGGKVHETVSSTDTDIERRFCLADNRLGDEGIGMLYGSEYGNWSDPNTFRIEVVLFTDDDGCMADLNKYAEKKFHDLENQYRRDFKLSVPEKYRRRYENIVKDGDRVSELNFTLPSDIQIRHSNGGKEYADHLFVNFDTGTVSFDFNTWEDGVIEEEEARDDFVCWFRNPEKGRYGLSISYKKNGETKEFRPDFLIIRKDANGYVIDILDPHRPDLDDNLGKIQGLAEYAKKGNPYLGRMQIIRKTKRLNGKDGYARLDVSNSVTRDKVLKLTTIAELNHLFETDGKFDC